MVKPMHLFNRIVSATVLTLLLIPTSLGSTPSEQSQTQRENHYYQMIDVPLPDDVVLEVGGLTLLDDGRIMAVTRRGEILTLDNAYADSSQPVFKRFAFGLAEPLGIVEHEGWIYVAQRGELTRIKDTNDDGKADLFETVTDAWQISGSFHEYAFGPRFTPDGKLWVTLNIPFGEQPYGLAKWRGWAVRVDPKTRKMEPVATGLRSPAGIEVSPAGDVFYTDNQGEWCNVSKLSHISPGDFHGHPHGLQFTHLPESSIKPMADDLPRSGTMMKDLQQSIPNFKMPAVWLPHEKLSNSPTGIKWDTSGGKFGPFDGQLFIGDQSQATILRVFLEQVNGHWQGAAFKFREGFQSGVTRMAFGRDHSMFVGMTARGWGGIRREPYGLQRLVWTGKIPFEVKEMRATPTGFELEFTQPVDNVSASNPASYYMESYTYRLRKEYGGPEEDKQALTIKSVTVSEDLKRVRLVVDPLRAGYVHELHLSGVTEKNGGHLLHDRAYYTLVNIP
jgi:glucose/arabinose dehydrogenase